MNDEPSICERCDHVHPDTKDERAPYRWRCLLSPTRPGYGFVSLTYSPNPPYNLCDRKNFDGRCPDFRPLRSAKAQP